MFSKLQTAKGLASRGVGVRTPAKFISWDACSIKKISNRAGERSENQEREGSAISITKYFDRTNRFGF